MLDGRSGAGAPRNEHVEKRSMRARSRVLATSHPRQGRIIDAISRVLIDARGPLQARDVHARVENLLGESVRWSSVKATLAGNLQGPTPRFVRIARGRYGASLAQPTVAPVASQFPGEITES